VHWVLYHIGSTKPQTERGIALCFALSCMLEHHPPNTRSKDAESRKCRAEIPSTPSNEVMFSLFDFGIGRASHQMRSEPHTPPPLPPTLLGRRCVVGAKQTLAFSRASSRLSHSWSVVMPALTYLHRSAPVTRGACPSMSLPVRRAASSLPWTAGSPKMTPERRGSKAAGERTWRSERATHSPPWTPRPALSRTTATRCSSSALIQVKCDPFLRVIFASASRPFPQ